MIKRLYSCFFLVLLSFQLIAKKNEALPLATEGLLDLSEWDFNVDGNVRLDGDWEFYWESLLFFGQKSKNKHILPFPQRWSDIDIPGLDIPSTGYATYRLKLILPENRPLLALQVPAVYTSYELYINNKLFSNNGLVANRPERAIAKSIPLTRSLPTTLDTLLLTLQISNFHHAKGGINQSLILGEASGLLNLRIRNFSLDVFLAGSLLMGGLFFLGLFLFGSHSKSLLYFSLFCIVYGYRVVGSGLYAFNSLFPELPYGLTLRLEYISLYLSAFLFFKYTAKLYSNEMNDVVDKVFSMAFILLSSSALLLPSRLFTLTLEPFFIIATLAVPFVIVTHIKGVINKRIAASYGAVSTSIIIFVFFYGFLSYFNIFEGSGYFTFFSYLAFFFLQSLVLSFRYSTRLKMAKDDAEQAAIAKTEFLSTMSHEIRTPLNAVVGLTNYLIQENPRKDQVESLDTLKFASENLLSLINDILDYNKIEAGKIEFEQKPINIRNQIDKIVLAYKPIADDKGIEFSCDIDPKISKYIEGDATRLSQVLNNLVSNAIKFTKEGHVKISLNMIARVDDRVAIKFTIEDTGIGIPQNKLLAIFNSFTQASSSTTREFGGSGLGLSITDKLLDLQGVKLNVWSEEGEGTRFYFTQFFLVVSGEEMIVEEKKAQHLENLEGHSILLVEDNPVNVMVAEKFLKKWRLHVESVQNGREAMRKVHERKYDLILMDLQMPVMDGYNTTIAMRNKGIKTPIIALTAAALQEVTDKVAAAGMDDYITKPFNPDILFEKLQFYIKGGFDENEAAFSD